MDQIARREESGVVNIKREKRRRILRILVRVIKLIYPPSLNKY